jgi:hypothetical protein
VGEDEVSRGRLVWRDDLADAVGGGLALHVGEAMKPRQDEVSAGLPAAAVGGDINLRWLGFWGPARGAKGWTLGPRTSPASRGSGASSEEQRGSGRERGRRQRRR